MSNVYWRGGAAIVRQVTRLTFTGTWAAADTYRLSIGGKFLLVTVGSTATTTQVATDVAVAFAAVDATTGLGTGYSRNIGGQQIPEFQGIVATNPSAGVVELMGLPTGEPFTIVSLATTAGTGDVTVTAVTAATGPNDLSNPSNYLAGALPVSGDTLIFDAGSVDVLDRLDVFRTGSIEINVKIYGNWKGQLGRPPVHPSGYPEYRDRYFEWQTNPSNMEILPAIDGSTDQKALYIDLEGCPGSTVRVLAARGNATGPSIFFNGGDASVGLVEFQVERGNVLIEGIDSTATNKFFADAIAIGIAGGGAADCTVEFGKAARVSEATSFVQYSGTVTCAASFIVGAEECKIQLRGGTFRSKMFAFDGSGTPALQDVDVSPGATFMFDGEGSVENVDLGGTWDMRQGSATLAILGDFTVNKGAAVYDPGGRGVDKLKFAPTCSFQDCTIQTGPGLNWAA